MKAIRPTSTALSQLPGHLTRSTYLAQRTQSRPFVSGLPNPFAPQTQTLTATRTLPYPATAIYRIIADVSSYSAFLPYCRTSTVTAHSTPDSSGTTWPEEARLSIGFSAEISEDYHSRIYCAPSSFTLEAVSGATETTLPADAIAHHNPRPSPDADPSRNATVLTHLLTRWHLRPFPYKPGPISGSGGKPQEEPAPLEAREQTEVNLSIEYCFANPLYSAMSAAAAPKVAEKMVEAFECRVRAVLDGPSMGGTSRKAGTMEGVFGGREKP